MAELYMIHALKELPILKDRISDNQKRISQYASGINTMIPEFKTENEQRNQVKALVQSTMDLIHRYLNLKRNISYTNAMLTITIEGKTYTAAELITIRKEMKSVINNTYNALNPNNGNIQLGKLMSLSTSTDMAKISTVLYYDEAIKNKDLKEWYDFESRIDAELEIFNARTLLLDSKTGVTYVDE